MQSWQEPQGFTNHGNEPTYLPRLMRPPVRSCSLLLLERGPQKLRATVHLSPVHDGSAA